MNQQANNAAQNNHQLRNVTITQTFVMNSKFDASAKAQWGPHNITYDIKSNWLRTSIKSIKDFERFLNIANQFQLELD